MVIKPFERLRYHVESESGGHDYLVDLASYNGNGQCSCADFRCRKEPSLATGAAPSPRLRCKHIRSCRELLCDFVISETNANAPDHRHD